MSKDSDAVNVQQLQKTYNNGGASREILTGVSFTLDAGRSLAIMGPSGSGKTTLLNILGTLDTPSAGSVRIFGQDPFALNEKHLALFRNRTIGFIFQMHHLLPQCSVIENVLLPAMVAPTLTVGSETVQARAARLLDRVGLSAHQHARPGHLSGGECQRVAVVRALINSPKLLLADEPTGSLDHANAEEIARLLTELRREENVALVVVTHSKELAQRMDETVELCDGRFVEESPKSNVQGPKSTD